MLDVLGSIIVVGFGAVVYANRHTEVIKKTGKVSIKVFTDDKVPNLNFRTIESHCTNNLKTLWLIMVRK